MQTPSSDNERGQATGEWTDNKDKIKYIRSEGPKTVGALLINVNDDAITLTLYNHEGAPVDSDNLVPGLYIRRQGAKASKIIVR